MPRSVEHSPRAWARLRVDINCALRRGAWYRVVRFARDQVVLDVMRERVTHRRRLFQTTFAKPIRWTVVPRPADAIHTPKDWGARYLVCPACQGRAPVSGFPLDRSCPSCHGVFAIAWDEHYLRKR
jgi:hypothetical protein